MHCMYSGMAKGTSRAETTLNSKKNQARSLSPALLSYASLKAGRILLNKKGFRINLKFFGPNQYCHIVM